MEEDLQPVDAPGAEDHHPHAAEEEIYAEVVFFLGAEPRSPSSKEDLLHRRRRTMKVLEDPCD